MAKFSAEDKLGAVQRYLNSGESYESIGKSIGAVGKSIEKWVKQFEHHGVHAFIKQYTKYTPQFKLDVLNFMTEHGTSLLETAAIFNIAAHSSIVVWKKQLELQGLDALQPRKKGRPSMKKNLNKQPKPVSAEGSKESLLAENERLRMENEYLKKLNALVQSKEKSPKRTK